MPIVFVHGVNNRDGEAYRENEQARDAFLKEIVAPALGMTPDKLQVFNPYWGEHGVQFAWGMAVLPNPAAEFEAFGTNFEAEAQGRVASLLADSHASGDIAEMARQDFPAAIDLLYASAMAAAESEEDARGLAKSYELALAYAEANPQPAWLTNAEATNFADSLTYVAHASDVERFGAGGILDSLKEGVSRLINATSDATTAVAGRLLRKKLNATITRFAGDAFVYLRSRGTVDNPGPMVSTVLADLQKASAISKEEGEPLVVIAHSFGGEIMYDILTYFDPNTTVDCLITVGSQVGLFEEMKLFEVSSPTLPPNPPEGRVERPSSLKRWLNVFDTNDVLSYRLEPVITGVSDFHYDTGYSSFGAHGGYFMRPSFYKRIAKRLAQG
ncbi:hypothetical protein [Delftia tsuruhatensis]|uniref:hypothetical protein n=1 Tax=Delftia tsuruhatensis TaxID=180282 RepID=UPI002091BF9D|nr:hypothetical protein [Delftia tsuruhatensis]MCO5337593.1 hypothetical protein [Delftia tsuruhatensis]MCR4545122.1 hypothetical protein [Delftia tsuruhatensis]